METIIGLFCFGLSILIYLLLKGRFSFLLLWPYIIYGFGLIIAMYSLETGSLDFSNMLDERSIVLSMYYMLSFLIIITLIDFKFLSSNMINKTMDPSKLATIKRIVDSPIFLCYLFIHIIAFLILYYLSYRSGELNIGDYNYSELEMLRYWGPIAYLSENIATLFLLFISRMMIYEKWTKSNLLTVILFLIFIVLRLSMGTRMFIIKIIGVTLIMFLIRYKKYWKVSLFATTTLIVGNIVGYIRSGKALSEFDISQMFYSLNVEAYFNDLTLIVATNALAQENFIYQPGMLLAIPLYSLPRFLVDRNEFINLLYDRNLMLPFLSSAIESVSPVGAMSFLADAIYAFGVFYWIFLMIVFTLILSYIAKLKGSLQYFICYLLGAATLNLWRDSFFITFKIVFIHGIMNILLLLIIIKLLSRPIKQKNDSC
ncbi:oligosaccharide repeat unit polymerase|uniref:Oligosaccharide repeat unit polymerase n=1 Tax=Dendrosporobacter quercicolus TaxID=146817 RepID=A0A1G9WPP3_9FIRM|nr:O-antigen polymerase [Dendrosporobacter quercicolus]NSL49174.1 oligosaccharide repeat unit polymerase [Dendrosporobacter quercicolus DSM 1736]SDM86492.1 hypothetical protein SAMN04488502_10849 [Dendrosporobacter quercicolus]